MHQKNSVPVPLGVPLGVGCRVSFVLAINSNAKDRGPGTGYWAGFLFALGDPSVGAVRAVLCDRVLCFNRFPKREQM